MLSKRGRSFFEQDRGTYLPGLDGLRAIAITLVLCFHAGIPGLEGGFIGVDLFFVISGFLITGLVSREIADGPFSLKAFYLRRAARLLPALFATIVLTLMAAFFVVSPDMYSELGQSALAATFSFSNVYFWLDLDYFDQAAHTRALLHTWSLGVEEQFYLFWPLILLLSLRLGRWGAFALICVLGLVSVVGALWFQSSHPNAVFFLMPFRVFQFAIGAIIALSVPIWRTWILSWLGYLAIAGLVYLAFVIDAGRDSVLLTMMAPALLAGVTVICASSRLLEPVLSAPIISWIGKRAYAIYLVHWPVMVLWPLATDYEMDTTEGAASILVSILFGAALHTMVEQPFRLQKARRSGLKIATLSAVSVGFLVSAGVSGGIVATNGQVGRDLILSDRLAQTGVKTSPKSGPDAPESTNASQGRCFMRSQDAPGEYDRAKCAARDTTKSGPHLLVLGDSYAGDLMIALKTAYPDTSFGHYVIPGCGLLEPEGLEGATPRHCGEHFDYAYHRAIPTLDIDGVVLASDWTNVSPGALQEVRKHFQSRGLPTGVIGLRPRFRTRIPDLVATESSLSDAQERAGTLIKAKNRALASEMDRLFSNDESYIALMPLTCPDSCILADAAGDLIYRDDTHFSVRGSVWLGRKLEESRPNWPEIVIQRSIE